MALIKQSLLLVLALMIILPQMHSSAAFAEEGQEMAEGGDVLNLLRLVL